MWAWYAVFMTERSASRAKSSSWSFFWAIAFVRGVGMLGCGFEIFCVVVVGGFGRCFVWGYSGFFGERVRGWKFTWCVRKGCF